tara:strand:- start:2662 stop:2856 length:195 start_codon:yes stop_codon:yes gene_type:complete
LQKWIFKVFSLLNLCSSNEQLIQLLRRQIQLSADIINERRPAPTARMEAQRMDAQRLRHLPKVV